MNVRAASTLLALPVRQNGIDLGRAVDVLLDLAAGRALGLVVRCGDDSHRFLPLGAARIGADAAEVESALTLLDDLAFYRARGTGMREVRGSAVTSDGRPIGTLADVLIGGADSIRELLVETPSGRARVSYGAHVSLGRERVPAA